MGATFAVRNGVNCANCLKRKYGISKLGGLPSLLKALMLRMKLFLVQRWGKVYIMDDCDNMALSISSGRE